MSSLPRARKRFGQHFLEPAWVDKLIESLEASPRDTFLEIGPGRGALTIPLAKRVKRLVAVEIDRDLAVGLPARLPMHCRIVQGDFLEVDVAALLAREERPVRVVGNLPYNASSPILFSLLRAAAHGQTFRDATLMLQKEVADRLVALPGGKQYGVLAVQVALLADVERILTLPPGAFRPAPKVTSAVVRLRFRPPSADAGEPAVFERLVRGVFLHRRKTLRNALEPVAAAMGRSAPELIARSGLDERRRPETLSVEEFASLSRAML
ncbi:MAG: 16S rRNA (adenine(1518)-N(6)/adenine(1519)-N(6))-dimethyltransferase RsmA [Vicinamibacterales bacterium]